MTSSPLTINKIPELRKRILFTLFVLAVYRFGVQVPTPGIDADALQMFFKRNSGTIFGVFNLFSGGALERFSIFALGIMPYISSSIIFQLLTVVFPYFEELNKEGEQGRKKINQYTRYATVVLSLIQGFFISKGLEGMAVSGAQGVVIEPGFHFRAMTMITLMAGSVFLMWLGEQITERGIGNGSSLIIFSGIASGIPRGFSQTLSLIKDGTMSLPMALCLAALMFCVIGFIIWFERAHRRVPIQYAKRQIGRKLFGGQSAFLPLKLNVAGVIPPIFASSLIVFPATLATVIQTSWMKDFSQLLQPNALIYNVIFVGLIIFFSYFYTAVAFNTKDVSENLKKNGGFIPGIRPGQHTEEHFDRLLSRLTLVGALYLAGVCVLPSWVSHEFKVSFYFGGTSLLILVGVCLDTVAQVESHLVSRNYDSFMKGSRIRGRRFGT